MFNSLELTLSFCLSSVSVSRPVLWSLFISIWPKIERGVFPHASAAWQQREKPFLSIILKPELCLQLGRDRKTRLKKFSFCVKKVSWNKKANYIFSVPSTQKKILPKQITTRNQKIQNPKKKTEILNCDAYKVSGLTICLSGICHWKIKGEFVRQHRKLFNVTLNEDFAVCFFHYPIFKENSELESFYNKEIKKRKGKEGIGGALNPHC